MESIYILGGLRSHIGLKNGVFQTIPPEDLAAALLQALLDKYSIAAVDQILCGNAVGSGGNITRLMALKAGIKESVPAFTVDMQCASAALAIDLAAAKLAAGQCDLVIAGGFESSSLQPLRTYAPRDPRAQNGAADYTVAQFSPEETSPLAMLLGAERTAQKHRITRSELDAWALESHRRAKAARERGCLDTLTVPLFGSAKDEGIRDKMSARLLSRLPLLLGKNTVTTSGNSCLTNDGAALVALCSKRYLQKHRARPKARIVASGTAGGAPLYSPEGAMRTADILLRRAGLQYRDLSCIEFNEAFAVIDVLFSRRFPDLTDRYNRFGGALAYGHPYGASGAILLLHLLAGLERTAGRYGLCSIAGAGGMGGALLIERCPA